MVLIDADGTVSWFNDACRRVHGWQADAVGAGFLDLFPQLADFDLDRIQAALVRDDGWTGRLILGRGDGTTYPGLVTIVPVYDDDRVLTNVVATSTDLTYVDILQRKLIAGFDNSPNGWAFTDLTGVVTECNPVFCEIVGRPRADVLGRTPDDFTHPADRDKRTPFQAMCDGAILPTFGTQKRYVRPDGSTRWIDLDVELVVDHRGEPDFFSGHVTDITSLVESLRETERLSRSYKELFGQGVTSIGRALELRDPYAIIQRHPEAGADILDSIPFPWPVARAVREHHERIDGSGYPNGLVADDIGIEARILAVADTIEVVASHRPYRSARALDTALEIVSDAERRLFDPEVASAARALFDEGFTIPPARR